MFVQQVIPLQIQIMEESLKRCSISVVFGTFLPPKQQSFTICSMFLNLQPPFWYAEPMSKSQCINKKFPVENPVKMTMLLANGTSSIEQCGIFLDQGNYVPAKTEIFFEAC